MGGEIGFVSHILAVGCWLLAVGLVELGSFCAMGAGGGTGIGFVFDIWSIGMPARRQRYGELGSFRIFWFVVRGW